VNAQLEAVEDRSERRRPSLLRQALRRLRIRDMRFFPLLDLHAQLCTGATLALHELLSDLADTRGRVREIEAAEKRGDAVVDEIHSLLRASFFPPFPRAAVVALTGRLDDILDLVEDAAQTIHLFHVTQLTPEAMRLSQLGLDCVRRIEKAVAALARRDSDREVLALCEQVDELESQADHVLRSALSRLFRDEPDARHLIRMRAVYEVLEELTDVCKDAAGEIESTVLGHLGN
jgi:predicted phosphate transport protein (TIGR00153 family)